MTSATSADELKIQIDRQQLKIWKMKNPEKAPPRLVCAVHRRQKCTPVIPKAGGNLLPNFGVVPQKTTYSRASLVTVGAACASFLIKAREAEGAENQVGVISKGLVGRGEGMKSLVFSLRNLCLPLARTVKPSASPATPPAPRMGAPGKSLTWVRSAVGSTAPAVKPQGLSRARTPPGPPAGSPGQESFLVRLMRIFEDGAIFERLADTGALTAPTYHVRLAIASNGRVIPTFGEGASEIAAKENAAKLLLQQVDDKGQPLKKRA